MEYATRPTPEGHTAVFRFEPVLVGTFMVQADAVRFIELMEIHGPKNIDGPLAQHVAELNAAEPEPEPEPEPEKAAAPAVVTSSPDIWTDNELSEAFEMLTQGDKLRVVADHFGKSWTKLRSAWAQYKQHQPTQKVQKQTPAPKPGSADMSPSEREVDAHLNALGYADGWTAQADLHLLSSLMRGQSLQTIATDLVRDRDDARARFKALNTKPGDIYHQQLLLRVLKIRAEAAQ